MKEERVKLPYQTRNPRAYRWLLNRLLEAVVDCGAFMLDCSGWRGARLEFVERRVYDRLSGLRLRLRVPVLVFTGEGGECRVEARWDGSSFTLTCEELERCCERVTRGP